MRILRIFLLRAQTNQASDPLGASNDSVSAAAAASVCGGPAGCVFGGLPVFALTMRPVVGTLLAAGRDVHLRAVLGMMGPRVVVSQPGSAEVLIVVVVLLLLLVSDVGVVLPARHLGVGEVGDGQGLLEGSCWYQGALDGDVVPRWS